jgi:hypothetical protein
MWLPLPFLLWGVFITIIILLCSPKLKQNSRFLSIAADSLSQCFFSYEDCTSAIAVFQFVLSFVSDFNSVSIALSVDFVAIVQGSG